MAKLLCCISEEEKSAFGIRLDVEKNRKENSRMILRSLT